jgi:carboxypeptidase D
MEVVHGRRLGDDGVRRVRVRAPAGALAPFDSEPLPPPDPSLPGVEEGDDRLARAVALSGSAGRVDLGRSVLGRTLWGAWFGVPPSEGRPSMRFVGGHHGDEVPGHQLALALAEALAEPSDPRLAEALSDRTVWVVPFANPDGVEAFDRYNADGLDLNRTYDVQWRRNSISGDLPFDAPETAALGSWGQLVRPAVGVALHAGAYNLGWVWNHTVEPAPDAEALEQHAVDYAGALGHDDFWVTNGAEWFVSYGDQNDWAYGRYGTWDYTLELALDKSPPDDELAEALDAHLPRLIDWIVADLREVRVVDAATGRPVEAVVLTDGMPRATDPVSGALGLWGGQQARAVSAPGYLAAEVPADGVVELVADALHHDQVVVVDAGEPLPAAWPAPFRLEQPGHAPLTDLRPGMPAPVRGGWYTVVAGDQVWPHGLAVADGEPFVGEGARAFVGGQPAWVEVAVDAPADLLWSGGAWRRAPRRRHDERLRPLGAACAVAPTRTLAPWLVSLVALARRRR